MADTTQREMHTPVTVEHGWTLYVAHEPAERLVVFVHGFRGGGLKTWLHFPEVDANWAWWRRADLLFVDYDSTRENIAGVSNAIRQALPAFYPTPHPRTGPRPLNPVSPAKDYEHLCLVGHSLGGVVLRRALADIAQRWRDAPAGTPRPALLDAELRLFSPASAGFQPAGRLGTLHAAAGIWGCVELYLRQSSTYTDLQPGSEVLSAIRRRTEEMALLTGMEALRADILWANPDNVVVTERYDTDHPDDSERGTSHRSVCKPFAARYETPWKFVESGAR